MKVEISDHEAVAIMIDIRRFLAASPFVTPGTELRKGILRKLCENKQVLKEAKAFDSHSDMIKTKDFLKVSPIKHGDFS